MAIGILSSPQSITPSDNPIVWTFSSNQTGQANFSYVVEVYVNATLESRREVFPEVGDVAHIDIQEIMMSITPVASVTQSTVVKEASNFLPVSIIVTERYGTTPEYHASASSSTTLVFKARLTNEEMSVWDYTQYSLTLVPLAKFLTDRTVNLSIKPDKDFFLTIFSDESDIAVTFKLYEEDGTSIPGAEVPVSAGIRFIQINVRTSFLVAETIIPQDSFDAAAYMDVFMTQLGGDPISETVRIYFDRSDCGVPTHLVWLNRFGGFDVFNSTHNVIHSSSVETRTFEKQFGEWQGSDYVLDSSNSGELDYLKTTKDRLTVVTGFLDDETQNYLTEVYESPMVYISGSAFKRVSVRQTSYELQNDLYEEEFTEAIEIALPNVKRSIRL